MRILLWILGIPVLIVALAIILIPVLVDEKGLVELAAEEIRKSSGIELSVDGDASLSLFPQVSLATTDVRINIPDSGSRIKAKQLATGVALFPLFTGSVEIDSIIVDGVTVETLVRDDAEAEAIGLDTTTLTDAELDGFYAVRKKMRETAAAEAAAGALAVPLALEVGELSLTNIRVVSVDSEGTTLSEVLLENLLGQDLNLQGRPVPVTGSVIVPGEPPIKVLLSTEFTADIEGESLILNSLELQIAGATQEPLTVATTGTIDLNQQIAELDLSLRSGTLEGSGQLRYATFESPQIDADLALTELNPALLVLAGPDAVAAAEDGANNDEMPKSGDAALPLHALRMVDSRASLRIEQVVLDAHVLRDVDAKLRIVDGIATLEPVTATLHGGRINFRAVFDGHYNVARLETAGGLEALDVAEAVAALDMGLGASGSANLSWTLDGSGANTDELTGSLQGPISFTTEDITLEGLAVEKMICDGVALVNQESLSAEFPTDTQFQALGAEIQLADGVARLDPLTAQLTAITLTGNGNVDLASQDLRASFRAQLSPELGELDPACRINERYTELRWPMECKGNLADDPSSWCGVSTDEILRDLAENEVKRKVGEEAGRLLKKLFE